MNEEMLARYKLAAEQGDVEAQFKLGEYYFDKRSDAETDEEEELFSAECLKYYTMAAEQGHATAQRYLGEFYETGIIVEDEDEDKAEKWYKLAAEQGDVTGQYRLADLSYGMGKTTKAVKWFKAAAAQGDADSMLSLGKIYYEEKDDEYQAFSWYQQAAELGHNEARIELAVCYLKGIGTRRDGNKALELIQKAVEQGIDEYY